MSFTADLVQGLEDYPERRECFWHHALGGFGFHTTSCPSHKQAPPPASAGCLQNWRQVVNQVADAANRSLEVTKFFINNRCTRSVKQWETIKSIILIVGDHICVRCSIFWHLCTICVYFRYWDCTSRQSWNRVPKTWHGGDLRPC